MEFNSQICTTREQSERLLALGLNPETADMKHIPYSDYAVPKEYDLFLGCGKKAYTPPAWSLHRLIEIGDFVNIGFLNIDKMYECCIQMIEGQIRGGVIDRKFINKIY